MLTSQVLYRNQLPPPKIFKKSSLLIYDKALEKHPFFKTWTKDFSHIYKVTAGESLKDIGYFPSHIQKIINLTKHFNSKDLQLIVVGGGSVGDFGGFVASTLRRGVELIHIPSTWLSAIDSSHGGKTALNVSSFKNQIGTFYGAKKIYIVKSLLETQPAERATEALGEIFKTALLDKNLFNKKIDVKNLWFHLPKIIQFKYKIIKKDPYEKRGLRQILNLGHTLGHALEVGFKIPHGLAVGYGLRFALFWSNQRGYLSKKALDQTLHHMPGIFLKPIQISKKDLKKYLAHDKKKSGEDQLTFIFLKGVGRPFRSPVFVEEIIEEAHRQGWLP